MALRIAFLLTTAAFATSAPTNGKFRVAPLAEMQVEQSRVSMKTTKVNITSITGNHSQASKAHSADIGDSRKRTKSIEAAMQNLLVDFAAVMKESEQTFMTKCLAHVQELIDTVDENYSDMQLESVLVNECLLAKEFPGQASSGFTNASTCKKFAKKLSDARMYELETGRTNKYREFCADYYAHKSAKEEKKTEKSAAAQGSIASAVFFALAILSVQ